MSKRRNVGDIVLLNDGDGEADYMGRISPQGADRPSDECPHVFLDSGHDPLCREWPVVDLIDENLNPTGGHVYHVAECRMRDCADN